MRIYFRRPSFLPRWPVFCSLWAGRSVLIVFRTLHLSSRSTAVFHAISPWCSKTVHLSDRTSASHSTSHAPNSHRSVTAWPLSILSGALWLLCRSPPAKTGCQRCNFQSNHSNRTGLESGPATRYSPGCRCFRTGSLSLDCICSGRKGYNRDCCIFQLSARLFRSSSTRYHSLWFLRHCHLGRPRLYRSGSESWGDQNQTWLFLVLNLKWLSDIS